MHDALNSALVSFTTGLIIVTILIFIKKDLRIGFINICRSVKSKQIPVWQICAGMLGASFIIAQTHIVPLWGITLFMVSSLAGQTVIPLLNYHIKNI